MSIKTFLVIDDDPIIHEIITKAFKKLGKVNVVCAMNGMEGIKALYEKRPDLVFLDIMMPKMDGWETCKQIRMVSDTPVIMLTGLSDEENAIRGLESGADDFIGKPFNIKYLKARVNSVLRRINQDAQFNSNIVFEDEHLRLDFNQQEILVNGNKIKLTRTEFTLLEYLVRNKGVILSYANILTNVWGWEYQDSPDYTHVYISHLRRKIDKVIPQANYFHTVYGFGYRFEKAKS